MKPRAWDFSEFRNLLLVVALALAGAGAIRAATPDAGAVQTLAQAAYVHDEAATPPGDDAAWQAATLPEASWRARPGQFGSGWYRFEWTLASVPQAPQAVYLPKAGRAAELWVNGRLVGRFGTRERPELVFRPQLFAVDASLLQAGANLVHLRVFTAPSYAAVVAAPRAGPAAAFEEPLRWRQFFTVSGPQLLFGVALVLALFMLVLAAKRPREATLGRFGIVSLMYAAFLLDWVLVATPVSMADWQAWRGFTLQGINVSTLAFALSYGGWRLPRWALWGLWATVPLVAYGYGADARADELPFDIGLLQTASILGYIGTFAAVAWRRRTLESAALAIAAPGCLLDSFAFQLGRSLESVSLFPYSFLALFALTGWILVDRFARALGEAELLNTELEQRVEAKRAELERQHGQLRQLEQQQAIATERQRLMSDMHDGIGGQLMTTLGLVEHGRATNAQVAAALRDCIDDLRALIDSIEPVDDDLLPVLGNLRYRLESRLRQQGIRLEWQLQDLPRMPGLTPRHLLHILRILQEAFTNVIKHAQASCIRVETALEGGRVAIHVADDGRGFDEPPAGTAGVGRGLANMAHRARTIGGDLRISRSERGTTLSLLLPAAA